MLQFICEKIFLVGIRIAQIELKGNDRILNLPIFIGKQGVYRIKHKLLFCF
jgi:hypothetical protein